MDKPFDFEELPFEVAAALRDMIAWTVAKEKCDLPGEADALGKMDGSATVLALWCGQQGELRQQIERVKKNMYEMMKDNPHNPMLFPDPRVGDKRAARGRRIAAGRLKLVKDE